MFQTPMHEDEEEEGGEVEDLLAEYAHKIPTSRVWIYLATIKVD